jgi:hypothetical protein
MKGWLSIQARIDRLETVKQSALVSFNLACSPEKVRIIASHRHIEVKRWLVSSFFIEWDDIQGVSKVAGGWRLHTSSFQDFVILTQGSEETQAAVEAFVGYLGNRRGWIPTNPDLATVPWEPGGYAWVQRTVLAASVTLLPYLMLVPLFPRVDGWITNLHSIIPIAAMLGITAAVATLLRSHEHAMLKKNSQLWEPEPLPDALTSAQQFAHQAAPGS